MKLDRLCRALERHPRAVEVRPDVLEALRGLNKDDQPTVEYASILGTEVRVVEDLAVPWRVVGREEDA